MTSYEAKTPYGTFTRNSAREYRFCVARADGWHQFSMTREAAERELRYQQRKGREVVMVPADQL